MIKKIILGFVSCVSVLLGFSSAGYVEQVGHFQPSQYNNQYNIQVINKGSFLTQFLGTTKDVFLIDSQNFFIWDDVGNIYVHRDTYTPSYGHSYHEGFVDYYFSCDVLTGGSSSPTNCTASSVDSSTPELYSNFLKTVNSSDYYYYNLRDVRCYSSICASQIMLCVSSSSLNKSLCWAGGFGGPAASCPTLGGVCPSFSNSQGFGEVNFGSLNGYPSPAVDGLAGSNDVKIDFTITGDYNYYDCSYRDVLTLLNTEGYNKYICYGGLDNYDLFDSSVTYNPIPGSGLSISQIWAWNGSRAWDNFSEWFHFWNGLYLDSDNNYNAMWSSYPAVYHTYFQLYNTYNSTEYGTLPYQSADYILNYCQLMDNVNNSGFNLDSSAGGQFKFFCEQVVREKQTGVWSSRADGSIYSDGVYTGDGIPVSVNWNGLGGLSGSGSKDSLNFIQNAFNLAKSKFNLNKNNLNVVGIIPGYILVFMVALILFRFLARK